MTLDPESPKQDALDAFISYATEDRRVASRLQIFLQRFKKADGSRLRVYLDETNIRGGDLTQELSAALELSATLIVVCSKAGASSTWVRREIELFLARDRPRVALVLAADDPASAVPTSLRSSAIRFHDIRRGTLARVWKPRARNELLRLVAWLTDANLSTLINWERRRLVRNSLFSIGVLVLALAAVYRYASLMRPIEASDITAEIVFSWTIEEGTPTIDDVMLDSPRLNIDVLPRSDVPELLPWQWPTNAQRSAGMGGRPVRLLGRLESHELRSSPTVDGVWHESTRQFEVESTSLGSLSNADEWNGAVAAAAYSALGLGTGWPSVLGMTEAEHNREITAEAEAFYGIDKDQWQDLDYSVRGVPVRGVLTISLRNRRVARTEALALRVWENDEDARDLHVLVFKPFRLDGRAAD